MLRGLPIALAVAALPLFAAPAPAQPMPQNNPPAAQNVRQSRQYEALVHSSAGFRKRRTAEECGPITDPDLHAQCVASFTGAAPSGAKQLPPSETTR